METAMKVIVSSKNLKRLMYIRFGSEGSGYVILSKERRKQVGKTHHYFIFK